MKIFHHYHHHKLHAITPRDLRHFEFSVWLHMIGYSVINIFIPVLMLMAGYSVQAVLVYLAVYYLLDTPLNYAARSLIIRFGAKTVTVIGTASTILYFLIFPGISGNNFVILGVLAALAAIYDSFYWVAHIYMFIEASGRGEDVSRNNGLISSIRSFGGMLGPAVGAGILLFAGDSALLWVSIFFLGVSLLPLAFLDIRDRPKNQEISHRKFFQEIPERKNFLSWFLYSIHWGVDGWIWPVFIFTYFGTLRSIALLAVIMSISKIVLSYTSGLANSKNRDRLIMIGTAFTLFIWIARVAYPNPVFYYLSILLMGFFAVLIEVPLDSNVFERARLRGASLDSSTLRNAIIMFPQGIMFAVLALLVGVFKISFASAIGSLALLLLVNGLVFSCLPKK